MAIYPDDLDLAPFEERLRQCLGNAAVAIRSFYPQDITALVNEIKRLRLEREIALTGVKGEPIKAAPDPVAEITRPPVPGAPSTWRAPVMEVSNLPVTDPAADQVAEAEIATREEQVETYLRDIGTQIAADAEAQSTLETVSAPGSARRGKVAHK